MIFVLTNCLASALVVGGAAETTLGVHRGAFDRRRLRRDQRRDRDLGAAAADRHDDRHRRDLFRHRAAAAAVPRRLGERGSGRRAYRARVRCRAGELRRAVPRRADRLGAVQPLDGRTGCLRVRLAEAAAYMSGLPIRTRKIRRLCACRPAGRDRRPVPHLLHLYRRGGVRERQRLYAVFDRRRGAGRRVAVRRHAAAPSARSSARSRSARSATCCSCSISTRCGNRSSRAWCCWSPSAWARSRCSACATSWSGSNERPGRGYDTEAAGLPAVASIRRWRRLSPVSSCCSCSAASIRGTSSRPNICCSSSRWRRSSA